MSRIKIIALHRIAKELYGGLYGDLVMLKNFISIYRMLKYNLWGYLIKNSTNKQIEKAINAFNAGVNYDNQITEIVNHLQSNHLNKEITISDRELEINRLFTSQYSGKEIAEKLNVNLRTIEKHKEILMQNTQVNNFIGVIIFAFVRHYLTEDDLF